MRRPLAIALLAPDLVPADYADHWQQTLAFLEIVTETWPAVEADSANVNAVHTPRKADMGGSTSVHGTEVAISPVA